MTEPTDDDWWEALRPFVENPKDAEPDLRAFVTLLRKSDDPLPGGVRYLLAELFDSRLAYALAFNWQLRPKFAGWHDDEAHRVDRESRIRKALAAAPTPTDAMTKVEGMSDSSAWRAKRQMTNRRAFWDALLEKSGLTDEQKTLVRRSWDASL